jgi:DNA-binding PadR family transcriptional regulator
VTVQRELGPGEWSVLALLADAPAHGWAVSKQMSKTGEVGRVWSMGRPLVYRALDLLEARGLLEAVGSEPGARGPHRTLFRANARGREELIRWLAQPVEHVRDVRSLLLLKLILIDRAGLESTPLLKAQRELTVPAVGALEERLERSVGTEQVFVRFRLETTRAVVSFIDGILESSPPAPNGAARAASS